MNKLNICPSTLEEGYDTYSPSAIRSLFDGRKILPLFSATVKTMVELTINTPKQAMRNVPG